MTLRLRFHVTMMVAGLCLASTHGLAQTIQSGTVDPERMRAALAAQAARAAARSVPTQEVASKPNPGIPLATGPAPRSATGRSLLDEPAVPAKIELSGDLLSINATNASLSEVIRQVATRTGMQVEGNSRDERVFGTYGPGSPPDVLSALLYDSGYNVIMVGSTAQGAPRRLVLSTRAAAVTANGPAAPARTSDEDDEEAPAEAQQPPPPNPGLQTAPNLPPPTPGQPKTPQQMLEELQRLHQGQQAPELPHD